MAPPGAMKWVPKADVAVSGGGEDTEEVTVEASKLELEDNAFDTGGKRGKGSSGKNSGYGGKESRKGDRKGFNGKGDDHAAVGASRKGKGKDMSDIEYAGGGKAGGKDRGKGKGEKGGKGKGGKEDHAVGAKTVQEIEAEMTKGQAAKGGAAQQWAKRGPENLSKQPVDTKGSHCEVRKHSGMGCAVVSLESYAAREAIMTLLERKYGGDPPKMQISDVGVQIRRHTDKATKREVVTDLFVAWGHKQEKETPLPCDDIAEAFDGLFKEAHGAAPAGIMPTAQAAGIPAVRQPGGVLPPPPSHVPGGGAPPVAAGMPAIGSVPQHYDALQRQAAAAAMSNPYGGMSQPRSPAFPAMQQPQVPPYYYQQQAAYQQQQQQQALAMQQHQMRQMQHMQYLQQQQHQQQQMHFAVQPGVAPGSPQQPSASAQPQTPTQQPAPPPQQLPNAVQVGQPGVDVMGGGGEVPSVADAVSVPAAPAAAKPKIMSIVDPTTGKSIDMLGMNFEPRKAKNPMAIINPKSGQQVTP